MDTVAYIAVWVAGLLISLFNQYQTILAVVSPIHGRMAWRMEYTGPPIYSIIRLVSWLCMMAPIAILKNQFPSVHWGWGILAVIVLIAGTTTIAGMTAWKVLSVRHPAAFNAYEMKEEIRKLAKL